MSLEAKSFSLFVGVVGAVLFFVWIACRVEQSNHPEWQSARACASSCAEASLPVASFELYSLCACGTVVQGRTTVHGHSTVVAVPVHR